MLPPPCFHLTQKSCTLQSGWQHATRLQQGWSDNFQRVSGFKPGIFLYSCLITAQVCLRFELWPISCNGHSEMWLFVVVFFRQAVTLGVVDKALGMSRLRSRLQVSTVHQLAFCARSTEAFLQTTMPYIIWGVTVAG